MGEATDREPTAIAMFESWARATIANLPQTSARLTLEIIKHKQHDQFKTDVLEALTDWYSQSTVVRQKWRDRADEMIREAR